MPLFQVIPIPTLTMTHSNTFWMALQLFDHIHLGLLNTQKWQTRIVGQSLCLQDGVHCSLEKICSLQLIHLPRCVAVFIIKPRVAKRSKIRFLGLNLC